MKTFQIYQTVSREFFVEAESEAAAFAMIDSGEVLCDSEEELSLTASDVHDGESWESEKFRDEVRSITQGERNELR